MKKVLLLTAAIALLAVPAMAGIKDSRHNLGTTGNFDYRASAGVTQICMFCHTPHNPVQSVPLWNRNGTTGTWMTYSSSPTISLKKTGLATDSISLFCLSCHDGAAGLFARVQNQRNEGAVTFAAGGGAITATRTNLGSGGAAGNINLTNDHPVNVRLSAARNDPSDTSNNWAANDSDVTTNGLRLFRSAGTDGQGQGNDYVECASCHDPHKTDFGRFLRKSNDSSSLCLTCHKK